MGNPQVFCTEVCPRCETTSDWTLKRCGPGITFVCLGCNQRPTSTFVPKEVVRTEYQVDPDALPKHVSPFYLENDNRCFVCGGAGTELHHFVPKHLQHRFRNSVEEWPKEYLCYSHHTEWHLAITPAMKNGRSPHEKTRSIITEAVLKMKQCVKAIEDIDGYGGD